MGRSHNISTYFSEATGIRRSTSGGDMIMLSMIPQSNENQKEGDYAMIEMIILELKSDKWEIYFKFSFGWLPVVI